MSDDKPVYSDTGYFTRGRAGYRPHVKAKEKWDALWAVLGLFAIGAVFGIIVWLKP